MLIYSMSVSVDGFIADREGTFGWTVPGEELFRFHISQVRELGGYLLGRRLYETMLPWETDPSMRDNELWDVFADVWCALPKVVFSRTLESVQGNARLAEGSVSRRTQASFVNAGGRQARSSWKTVIGIPSSLIWSSRPRSCQPEWSPARRAIRM